MKFIKGFNESISNATIREKLESINDFYEYLCENDMHDSLSYIGECASLFASHVEYTPKWKEKLGGMPYILNVGGLSDELDKLRDSNARRFNYKLEKIEELYLISKIPRFEYTKSDIENMLFDSLNMTWIGTNILKSYEIKQFYSSWNKKPLFSIDCIIDENMLSADESEILDIKNGNLDYENKSIRERLREIEKESYSIQKKIVDSIKSSNIPNNFKISAYNNHHLKLLYNFHIKIEID